MDQCSHISSVPVQDGVLGTPPTTQGCGRCEEIGSTWLHLRRCVECGAVGCCDDSPNKHASAHARERGHVVMQSFEPGEDWVYCFTDDLTTEVDGAENSPSY